MNPGDIDIVRFLARYGSYGGLSTHNHEAQLGIGLNEIKKRPNRMSQMYAADRFSRRSSRSSLMIVDTGQAFTTGDCASLCG